MNKLLSLDDNLLHFRVDTIDEAEHINARNGFDVLAIATMNLFATHDAARDVNHLEGGITIVVDDPVAVIVEAEDVIIADASGKHQFETAGIIRCAGIKTVNWGLEQVDIYTCQIINEMEVTEANLLGIDTNGVGTVLVSREIDRHFTVFVCVGHSIILIVLRDVNLGLVLVKLELTESTSSIETDNGIILYAAVLAQSDVER